MFVQVIRGRTGDPAALRQRMDVWMAELMPGATGFLGSTEGVTDNGEFFGLARFESEDAARRNSDRPEQTAWWKETEPLFDGPVTFKDTSDVELFLGGGSDDAGFVQVMEGQVDRSRLEEAEAPLMDRLSELRPDVIGSVRAWHDDGTFTHVIYFTSEEAARQGESQPPPDDLVKAMEGFEGLFGDIRYLDLREPWLVTP
jgi:hypothetical protein